VKDWVSGVKWWGRKQDWKPEEPKNEQRGPSTSATNGTLVRLENGEIGRDRYGVGMVWVGVHLYGSNFHRDFPWLINKTLSGLVALIGPIVGPLMSFWRAPPFFGPGNDNYLSGLPFRRLPKTNENKKSERRASLFRLLYFGSKYPQTITSHPIAHVVLAFALAFA